jgi:hypothetical protein
MQRTRRLLDEVKARTGYDIKGDVKIVICDDEQKFLSIQARMKRKDYQFPKASDDILAFYFADDRYIAISPKVKPGTTSFDRVFLHECGHDLIRHEISPDVIRRLRRTISRRRNEIDDAYTSIDRKMPWSIEERLCDLISFSICPHSQRGWSRMKRIALEIMEPILT